MKPETRRRLLGSSVVAFVAGLFGKGANASARSTDKPGSGGEDGPLTTEGQVLRSGVYRNRPPMEPLDTMIRFERSDNNQGRAVTHEVLSLMHEEKGANSFPWTMYAHLSTQHVEGDACVVCSRLHKKGAGWACGLHSEVFNTARAVALGVNVEMSNDYDGPEPTEVIGVNVQAHGSKPCQTGIQVHDADSHFEKGIGLNGKGSVGLDLGGKFDVGIHTGHNSIRLGEGACIELDPAGRIRLRYRSNRIEFLNGDKVFAHLDVDGEDHAI